MIRRIFTRKFLVFYMIAVTAPFWLVLRSWYGGRFLCILVFATVLHIPLILYPAWALVSFMTGDTGRALDDFADPLLFIVPLGVYGIMMQGLLAVLNLARGLILKEEFANPGFAGSFLLWPSSHRIPPLDLLALAILAGLFATGHLTYEHLRQIVLVVNGFLASSGFMTPPVYDAPQFARTYGILAGFYVVAALWIYKNDGLLPEFDAGPRPAKPEPKPQPPLIAKIQNRAKPSTDTLAEIFSRRNPALKKIAGEG